MESDKQERASPANRFTLGEESIDTFETNGDSGMMLTNTIVPPGPERDRTGPERERYKDRLRQKLKGKASDVISKIPIITKPGVIKVPVDGGYEPSWIPGRDGQGGGEGEGGEPGNEKGDFVEMPFEEFVEWIFGELDLPNMLKKQLATTLVKSQKVKGISKHGPEARLNKRATSKQRIKRAASLRNAQPERFVADFAEKCQSLFDVYVFYIAATDDQRQIIPDRLLDLVGDDVEQFLNSVESVDPFPKMEGEEQAEFRTTALSAVMNYLSEHAEQEAAPYTCYEPLKRRIETYVYVAEREGNLIPSIEEVPFHQADMRYNRLQDKFDPDSKAVVFFVLDRSGSMTGDPLALCKMYFFLCVMFLRTRYKTVEIVLVSHDAQAYLWKTEAEFFNIGAGGGTVAEPAWELVYNIAEHGAKSETTGNQAGPYPLSIWNRFMFHGTDGDLFDGDDVIQAWWTRIIIDSKFSYCGYLECGTSWSGFGNEWRLGGKALKRLPPEVKARIGMARANRKDDVIQAFKEILLHNANEGGN